jgi:hypothetical protein
VSVGELCDAPPAAVEGAAIGTEGVALEPLDATLLVPVPAPGDVPGEVSSIATKISIPINATAAAPIPRTRFRR